MLTKVKTKKFENITYKKGVIQLTIQDMDIMGSLVYEDTLDCNYLRQALKDQNNHLTLLAFSNMVDVLNKKGQFSCDMVQVNQLASNFDSNMSRAIKLAGRAINKIGLLTSNPLNNIVFEIQQKQAA